MSLGPSLDDLGLIVRCPPGLQCTSVYQWVSVRWYLQLQLTGIRVGLAAFYHIFRSTSGVARNHQPIHCQDILGSTQLIPRMYAIAIILSAT